MVKIAAVILLASLLGYGAIKAYPLLRGPDISLSSPAPYASLTDGLLIVSGKALHTETLFLNGAPLLINEEGEFREELLLPQGGAVVTLVAHDRFGRSEREVRTVYVP